MMDLPRSICLILVEGPGVDASISERRTTHELINRSELLPMTVERTSGGGFEGSGQVQGHVANRLQ